MATIEALLPGQRLRTNQGSVGFASVYLVDAGIRIVVDCGHVGRRTSLLAALGRRGLTPSDIDVMLLTHAHWDHAQNIDLFRDAALAIHPLERRYAHRPHVNDWSTPSWTGPMLEAHGTIREISDGETLAPGVTAVHVPGHTVGSLALMVETDDGVAAIAGDAIHFPSTALTGVNHLVFWNEAQAAESIRRITTASDLIYPGHDRPFRILAGGADFEYLAPFDLELWGVEPDQEGLRWDNSERAPWRMPGLEDQNAEALAD